MSVGDLDLDRCHLIDLNFKPFDGMDVFACLYSQLARPLFAFRSESLHLYSVTLNSIVIAL